MKRTITMHFPSAAFFFPLYFKGTEIVSLLKMKIIFQSNLSFT